SAAHPTSPAGNTWVSAALSFQGLEALGVPRASLESFPLEFQQGMAARAKILGDNGESSPENWEKPLGSADVHVVVTAIAPQPEILGRNGSYVVFRKLHQRVAAFRCYLKENSSSPDAEELLAAKMMGRWRSGAPLALCPFHDSPEIGADPRQNNAFLFKQED